MQEIYVHDYNAILSKDFVLNAGETEFLILDHILEFEIDLSNPILDMLFGHYNLDTVLWVNVVDDRLLAKYPGLKYHSLKNHRFFRKLENRKYEYAEPTFEHFICSFNGSKSIGRRLLLNALNSYGYYNVDSVTKNESYTKDEIDGYIIEHAGKHLLPFFINDEVDFESTINSIDYHRFDHSRNVDTLSNIITSSFVHVVSETLPTCQYPFVTEKFLYSVVNRGLFVAFAQPGWHKHLRDYYGFKLYDTIFDYSFDNQTNPVLRVLELLAMLSKFQNLNFENKRDLYLLEIDNINYNFAHFTSGKYKEHLGETHEHETV